MEDSRSRRLKDIKDTGHQDPVYYRSNYSAIIIIMGRRLGIEFSGALYQVTSRGDRRENIYQITYKLQSTSKR